jgi:glycosyltransferase involved in cell wall biosynthesis
MTQRLLVLTRHPPLPDADGAGAYLWDLLTHLAAAGTQIHVASTWHPALWRKQELIRVPLPLHRVARLHFPGALSLGPWRWFGWGSLYARTAHRARAPLRLLRKPAAPAPTPPPASPIAAPTAPCWFSPPSPSEERFFRAALRRLRPDAVLANFCWLAPLLPREDRVRTAVLAHDIMSDKLNLFGPAPTLPHPSPATVAGENALLSLARTVIAISETDAAALRARLPAPGPRVLTAPKAARPLPPPPGHAPVPGRVLFVGTKNPPNDEALAWLLAEIWPRVRAARPEATLHLVGDCAAHLADARHADAPPGVVARGRVPELAPEYHAASVVVAPLRRGSGMKIKVVEAASHGRAIVTTSIGLQGLPFLREAALVADQAPAFSAHIVALLADADLRRAREHAVLDAVRTHLSPEACYGPALRALAP